MKITVYSAKGSAGKTPIATNIALDRHYAIGTNELFHVYDSFEAIPDDRLMALKPHEEFPEIPDDIDIVFDLAGSISQEAHSITSAIRQSDLVIVPIYNEVKCLNAGVNTIFEVSAFTKNIVVVGTKLQKQRKEIFSDWKESEDFKNIQRVVETSIDFPIPMVPLKFSKVFDTIFEKELSIAQLSASDPLARYTYRDVLEQFNELYSVIDSYHAKQEQLISDQAETRSSTSDNIGIKYTDNVSRTVREEEPA